MFLAVFAPTFHGHGPCAALWGISVPEVGVNFDFFTPTCSQGGVLGRTGETDVRQLAVMPMSGQMGAMLNLMEI